MNPRPICPIHDDHLDDPPMNLIEIRDGREWFKCPKCSCAIDRPISNLPTEQQEPSSHDS